jgi:hypothetical protein
MDFHITWCSCVFFSNQNIWGVQNYCALVILYVHNQVIILSGVGFGEDSEQERTGVLQVGG